MSWGKFFTLLDMIKFEHTIFALPFAYTGALLAERAIPSLYQWGWITVAMVGARTAAMLLNRLIDRHIDAANPRTKERALPAGKISSGETLYYIIIALLVLALAAYRLSPLAFQLFPLVVLVLTFYSYTKRFTWTCHLFLGAAISFGPLGAWIAISNIIELPAILLAMGVMFWVAGFDIIYACADYEFDKQHGVFSIPARFGIGRALLFSKVFYLFAATCFGAVGILLANGLLYWLGVGTALWLLYRQHRLVSPADLSKANIAFLNLNGTLSMVMFVGTFLDMVIGR